MNREYFNIEKDGFYGAYWKNKNNTTKALIVMLGDNIDDYLTRRCVKYLLRFNVNVMSLSPGKNNYSHHNYPLERIKKAIKCLKDKGNTKIGIVGASTTATLALTASSIFNNDISLTIAMTPSDFIWQGFKQGNLDGCKEWPVEGESLFTFKGKMLPYMPFCYKHPDYWNIIKEESKKHKDMINSKKIFDDSELAHPIKEEEFIKVENIRGKLVLVGAKDDALWDTVKYINRIRERLLIKESNIDVTYLTYDYGTHYVFPEAMLKCVLPIGSNLFVKLAFNSARKHSRECKQTRIDIEKHITNIINNWIN